MDEQEYRSRPLHVKLSVPVGAKRTATTIVSRVSKSPSVEPNGMDYHDRDEEATTGERRDRTVALLDVPDTVNDARVRSLVEPFGKVIKIILRPDHRGAIVEFADQGDAGRASLGLDGREILAGRRIRVGIVDEMLKQRAERRVDRIPIGKQKEKTEPAARLIPVTTTIRRPVQASGRGTGRRGGLGVKRGGRAESGSRHATASAESTHDDKNREEQNAGGENEATGKTNRDFRAMISGEQ
jgi:squamous cell carcinoma antigen recognized by T-cells 3